MEFKITKEQIEALSEVSWYAGQKLKHWFPEVFKTELEVGKWYYIKGNDIPEDNHTDALIYIQEKSAERTYGFNHAGEWSNRYNNKNIFESYLKDVVRPATDEEVKEALIAEAKRRGYTTKNTKSIDGVNMFGKVDENYNFNYSDGYLHSQPPGEGGKLLFKNGQWAEIISEPIELTLEDIAEKFGVSVEEIKIKK